MLDPSSARDLFRTLLERQWTNDNASRGTGVLNPKCDRRNRLLVNAAPVPPAFNKNDRTVPVAHAFRVNLPRSASPPADNQLLSLDIG